MAARPRTFFRTFSTTSERARRSVRRRNGRCSGCHLALPATEIDRIKREAPDTIVLCDQCGRILVR